MHVERENGSAFPSFDVTLSAQSRLTPSTTTFVGRAEEQKAAKPKPNWSLSPTTTTTKKRGRERMLPLTR
eukprot:1418766-Rhodomonas_salina.3